MIDPGANSSTVQWLIAQENVEYSDISFQNLNFSAIRCFLSLISIAVNLQYALTAHITRMKKQKYVRILPKLLDVCYYSRYWNWQ